MLYFKNSELAKTYHVSVRTVLNWIEAAKRGKLDLVLYETNGRSYVSNTDRNINVINNLVEQRRKYRNARSQKTVVPESRFYEIYDQHQIFDLISELDLHNEIPHHYRYLVDSIADYWDNYAIRLANELTPNTLKSTQKLLRENAAYIDSLLKGYTHVNVIDVGVGNALPVRDMLARLLKQGRLGRYIAVDASPRMFDIAEANIRNWFGGKIKFESYQCNLERNNFHHLLAEEHIKFGGNVVNIVLFLGGTGNNFRRIDDPYRMINDSMERHDIFISTLKLDSEISRRYFDFTVEPGSPILSPLDGGVAALIGLDESLYEVEKGYDEHLKERYIRAKLKVATSINFKFDFGERIVSFDKGETILLWRAHHVTSEDFMSLLKRNNFYPLHVSQTKDRQYLLTVSQVA